MHQVTCKSHQKLLKSSLLVEERIICCTAVNYLHSILCVIEIQSKEDIQKCELQMQVYLLILMNTKNLPALVGFLIFKDGNCRAFKATRDESGGCLFEMNDLFHVCHIAEVMCNILGDLNLL
jgi:hypothetical protein